MEKLNDERAELLKSEKLASDLQNEVQKLLEEVGMKKDENNRLEDELRVKCEDMETLNTDMTSKYDIINELQNSLELLENKTAQQDVLLSERSTELQHTRVQCEALEKELAVKMSDIDT